MKEIDEELRKIITASFEIANNYQSKKLKPEHILISLIENKDNLFHKFLVKNNIEKDYLICFIVENLKLSDTNIITSNSEKDKRVDPNEITRKMFELARKETVFFGDNTVKSKHLILGLFKLDIELNDILANFFNITYEKLLTFINMNIDDAYNDDEIKKTPSEKVTTPTKKETPVLDNFCRNISLLASKGSLDVMVGREKEVTRVAQILSRKKKNNPILIGLPGVGKTAIVEGLAQLILKGAVPRPLLDKRIYSLDLAMVVAGTKYRGQFEERMKALMVELNNNKDVILFIDEFHTVVGTGNSSGSLDASNMLKPGLARGELQVIASTTLDEYREKIEKDGGLTRRFQPVIVEEPSFRETVYILEKLKTDFENYHKVKYTDEAVIACVKMADRYITDRAMPDKAIDVMDEAGASTNMFIKKPKIINDLEEQKEVLIRQKKHVVEFQLFEEAVSLRDKEKLIDKKLELEKKNWLEELDNNRDNVDANVVYDVISNMTNIPINKLSVDDNKRLSDMDKVLKNDVIGQDEAIDKITKVIKRSRMGIKDPKKPIGSIFCLGDTGIGKTFLAKKIAEYLFGDAESLIRIDMSEYMEKHSVSKLIGAPAGYIGHEEGGYLTEKVRRKPSSIVLFDEIEKAHEDVFNILLQVFDEGHLTDSLGRKVNFKNCLILLTSNVGLKEAKENSTAIGFVNETNKKEDRVNNIILKSLKNKFRPEFLNRLDDIITFRKLNNDDIKKIAQLEINKLIKRLSELDYKLTIDETVLDFISKEGYSDEYGVRPLNRAIQTHLEDNICEAILNNEIKEGDDVLVKYNKKKEIITVKKK